MHGGGDWLRKILGAAGMPTSDACTGVPDETRAASPGDSHADPGRQIVVSVPRRGLSTRVTSSRGAAVTEELLDSEKWEM
jgi:hypothetical protein